MLYIHWDVLVIGRPTICGSPMLILLSPHHLDSLPHGHTFKDTLRLTVEESKAFGVCSVYLQAIVTDNTNQFCNRHCYKNLLHTQTLSAKEK
jgi:hypothetical protein